MTPTDEQVAIVNKAETGANLVVQALAGSGKTSTLALLSKALSAQGKMGLYLAFNKDIATEAKAKMANTVDCRTVHSLAYKYSDKRLLAKLKFDTMYADKMATHYNVDDSTVAMELGDRTITSSSKIIMMNKTLTRFMHSADDVVSSKHFVYIDWMTMLPEPALKALSKEVVKLAREHWEALIDLNNKFKISHDVYLKVFALAKIELPVNYIMIDEAQDINPVMMQILDAQDCQKIFVGDSYQQIYAWRGSSNAMTAVNGEELFLSKSFRFGDNVALLANSILKRNGFKRELFGNGTADGETYILSTDVGLETTDSIICRTNAGCLAVFIESLENTPSLNYCLNCNNDEIKSFIECYVKLKDGVWFVHPILSGFKTVEELSWYAEEHEDEDILKFLRLIKKFGEKKLLVSLQKSVDLAYADVVITTAHKSKGLEWENVLIGSDFKIMTKEGLLTQDVNELNLLYVAVTRAKKNIDVFNIKELFKEKTL